MTILNPPSMNFQPTDPILQSKQESLDIQDLVGSWHIHWKVKDITLFSTVYTRIDQVFVLWGIIAIAVFSVAQFLPVSWITQAILWTMLTLLGAIGMVRLTCFWAQVERLMWVVYAWAVLMVIGVVLTNLGIWFNLGSLLINLCPLWLGLSALGYVITGLGIQSRALLLTGAIHVISIWLLPYVESYQYFSTGSVIGISLILLAQVQWDMRPPIEYSLLTEEQKVFNREQHQLRQTMR
ncbi:MAG: hypothetical protein Kow00121_59750 [Elainellaceae cyanobacterium]